MAHHLQRTSTAIRPTINRSPSTMNTIFKGHQLQSVPQKTDRHPHGTRSSKDHKCNPSQKKQIAIHMEHDLQQTSTAIRPTKNRSPSSWDTIFKGPQLQSVPQKTGRHHHGTRSSTDLNCNPSHKKQVAIIMEHNLQRTSTAIRPTNNRSLSSWDTIFKGTQLQSVPQKIGRTNPFGTRRKKSQRVPFDKT